MTRPPAATAALLAAAALLSACGETPMTAPMEHPPAAAPANPADPLPGPGQTTVTHPIP